MQYSIYLQNRLLRSLLEFTALDYSDLLKNTGIFNVNAVIIANGTVFALHVSDYLSMV